MRAVSELKLMSQNDYLNLFKRINEPLRSFYRGSSRIMFGSTGVGYGNKIAGIEGFARMLWGAGPAYWYLDGDWQDEIRKGIIRGTDPYSEDYWGVLHDRDQRMVEMPPIALALLYQNHSLWQQFSKDEQAQISNWLRQIFQYDCSDGNWQFFKVLVYQVLKHLGVSVGDSEVADVKSAMKKIDACYCGHGWYRDSARGRMDYYTAFAFQYYGILFTLLAPDDAHSIVFRTRAREFATQFMHFFDDEGANVPFGRSLTYRYASVAFWTAMVYGNVWPEQLGKMKGIINRNLRWWLSRPIFDEGGLLTLGYGYSQLSMTEPYNSPVSPYWSNKVFLLVALPATHPYWSCHEESFPETTTTQLLAEPHLLAMHDEGHTILLNAGQPGPNYHALTNEKYFKFAYSSQFGFSIPRENQLKEEAVMDSMIGLQATDTTMIANRQGKNIIEPGMFYTRNNVQDVIVDKLYLASTWVINDKMQVRTWLIPFEGWQLRIHRINTTEEIAVYETGFAIADSPDDSGKTVSGTDGSYYIGPAGFSGIADLSEQSMVRSDSSIIGFPNTNLMTAETVALPGNETTLEAGEHWLITGVYAHQDGSYALNKWHEKPQVMIKNKIGTVRLGTHEIKIGLS